MKRKHVMLLIVIILINILWIIPLITIIYYDTRVKNSIKSAVRYLTGLQNVSGLFYDFPELNMSEGYTHVYSHEYILDALIDAHVAGFCNQEIIEKGITWLLTQQDINGLWKFRDIVPPDSDESGIAAVAMMTHNSNQTPLIKTMEQFSKYQAANGVFPLWLNETLSNVTQTYDLDQTSVVLYSMFLFNSTKYSTNLSQGVDFIKNNQTIEGYWNCTYYYGPYYGTFISVRLLSAFGNSSIQLERSFQFLINSQHNDWGWGRDSLSNPLDTAFAILALTYLQKNGFDAHYYMVRGVNYLINTQFSNGSWAVVPFWGPMYAPLGIYQSNAMTTLFALKAIIRFSLFNLF